MNYTASITINNAPESIAKALATTDKKDDKSTMMTTQKGKNITIEFAAINAPALRAALNAKMQSITIAEQSEETKI